jgi:hypothetical protein
LLDVQVSTGGFFGANEPITDSGLNERCSFKRFADKTTEVAKLHGSTAEAAVRKAWNAVGIAATDGHA